MNVPREPASDKSPADNWRPTGIGGSDVAAALGVSPWKSPLRLWQELSGYAEPTNVAEVEAVKWGKRLEAAVALGYEEETGRRTIEHRDASTGQPITLFHPEHKFLFGHLDRWVFRDKDTNPGVLEIKTCSSYLENHWLAGPPLYYAVQLQHYLGLSGAPWGSFAVLIGGQKFVWMDVTRNDGFIESMTDTLVAFWKSVLDGEPPGLLCAAMDDARDAFQQDHPLDNGKVILLGQEEQAWLDAVQEIKAQQTDLATSLDELKLRLIERIGDHQIALFPDGRRLSYKTSFRGDNPVRTLREMRAVEVP